LLLRSLLATVLIRVAQWPPLFFGLSYRDVTTTARTVADAKANQPKHRDATDQPVWIRGECRDTRAGCRFKQLAATVLIRVAQWLSHSLA